MLSLTSVGKSHGLRTLFDDVSLQIVPGRRVGLVGPNGAGKTTLLEILTGDQQPDEGLVNRAKDLRVGYLRQDVAETFLGPARPAGRDPEDGQRRRRTVVDEVVAGAGLADLERRLRVLESEIAAGAGEDQEVSLAEYGRLQARFEHLGGYAVEAEARKVLAGLGFADADMDRALGEFSGGWMMRVALARLLLAGPDLLLLDEPTNHLDLDSVRWLEQFLAGYDGALVLVSHDRDFLNGVVNRIVELDLATATEYVGNYADFVEQRTLRMDQQRSRARNQQRKVAQTEAFIERFRYKASKARQVQSRIKTLDKLERIAEPEERRRQLRFRFPDPPRAGRDVVTLRGLVKRYGGHTVYDGLDLVIGRGQKVALVGPNGAGKTTLLRILAGVLDFDAGDRVLGHNVAVAHFAQHQVDVLDPDKTVLAEFSGAVDTSKVNPRSLLGSFLFSGDEVDKRVGVLSGGERSRLALAKLLANPANLLCMDEPTNHLDMASRDVLEDALVEYPGAVVLITHDRHLIRSVADTIVEVRGGTATMHPGDYEYFLDKVAERDARPVRATPRGAEEAAPPPSTRDQTDRKRQEAERRNRLYRQTKGLRDELESVEVALGRAEAEVAELSRTLADPQVYADGERVKELVAAHNRAKDRAAELFGRWERLYEKVERAAAAVEA